MRFVVDFKLDNDCFNPDPRPEIARILRELANKVENGSQTTKVYDINGNHVGVFGLAQPKQKPYNCNTGKMRI